MFDHEKLDVYRLSLKFTSWAYLLCKNLKGSERFIRDQMLRASQSIPQNIAEGNGKRSGPDRRRFFEIARGSAFECASILDILLVCGIHSENEVSSGKELLFRIAAMLSKMTTVTNQTREENQSYFFNNIEHNEIGE